MGGSPYSRDDYSSQALALGMQNQNDGSGRLAYLIAQELAAENMASIHATKSDPMAWYRIGDCYVFEYSNGNSETRCVHCFQEWKAGHNCLRNIAAMPVLPAEPGIAISEEVKTLLMDGMIRCEKEWQDDQLKREFERLERLSTKME